MSLTRKMLKAMGIEEEKIEQIIEAHAETVDALKEEVAKYKAEAQELPATKKELEDLKAKGDDGWKEKHDAVKREFDEYKNGQTAKETKAAKEKAARAYFEGKGIDGANLNIAIRSCGAEIDSLELDGDSIKDTAALDALLGGDLAGLVSKPNTNVRIDMGGKLTNQGKTITKEEILSIKDGSTRRRAMMENPDLFLPAQK